MQDSFMAAEVTMRTVSAYAEACEKARELTKIMYEEKYFGSIEEAYKLREEIELLEKKREELIMSFHDCFDDLFARYENTCKKTI